MQPLFVPYGRNLLPTSNFCVSSLSASAYNAPSRSDRRRIGNPREGCEVGADGCTCLLKRRRSEMKSVIIAMVVVATLSIGPAVWAQNYGTGNAYNGFSLGNSGSTISPMTAPTQVQPTGSLALPGAGIPRLTIPSSPIPRTAIPSTAIPRTAIPSAAIPRTTIPSAAIPRTAIPLSTIPRNGIPAFTLAQSSQTAASEAPASNAGSGSPGTGAAAGDSGGSSGSGAAPAAASGGFGLAPAPSGGVGPR